MNTLLRSTAIALVLSIGTAGGLNAASTQSSGSPKAQQQTGGGQSASNCPAPAAIDSNNDGFVTDQEADAHNVRIFEALDGNSDGAVSKFEYMQCQTNVTGLYQASQRDYGWDKRSTQAHKQMDADKDKSVSYQEYMKQAQERYSGLTDSGQVDTESYGREMQGMSSSSQAADTNRDKKISQDEAAADAARSFQQMDSDNNGKLSQDEWTGSAQQRKAEAAFSQVDKDGNGKISKEEFSQAGKAAFDQAAQNADPVTVWIYRVYEAY